MRSDNTWKYQILEYQKAGSLLKDNPNSKVLAYVAVTLEDSIRLDDIRIINGSKGTFLGFPTRVRKNGLRKNIAYPISREARAAITYAVMAKYKEEDIAKESVS